MSKISQTNVLTNQETSENMMELHKEAMKKSNAKSGRGAAIKKASLNTTVDSVKSKENSPSEANDRASANGASSNMSLRSVKKRKIDEMAGYDEDKSSEDEEKGTKKLKLNNGESKTKQYSPKHSSTKEAREEELFNTTESGQAEAKEEQAAEVQPPQDDALNMQELRDNLPQATETDV